MFWQGQLQHKLCQMSKPIHKAEQDTSNSLVVIRIHKKQRSVYALRFIKAAKFEQDGCHLFFE
jgi:hypothetical protein